MKKQPLKYVALVLSMGVLFMSACKKDNANVTTDPSPGAGTEQLAKIEHAGGTYSTFDYNSDGLMSKMVTKETRGDAQNITLTYNADKKVATATSADGLMKFNYDSNKALNKIEYWANETGGSSMLAYTNFTIQDNKVAETKMFVKYTPADIPGERVTYTYNNAGDATIQKTYQWSFITNSYELKETSTLEYDDKKNPLAAKSEIAQAFFQVTSVHNPKKKTITDAQNNVTETDTYSYTYDTKGYPLTQTETSVKPNTNTITTQVTFTYK